MGCCTSKPNSKAPIKVENEFEHDNIKNKKSGVKELK